MEGVAFLSLFLLGLSYGATACMLSCMPLLSPILLANSRSLRHAMGVVLPFSIGRVFSYMLIALLASLSVAQIRGIIDNPAISQTLLGTATLAVAGIIFYRSFKEGSSCSKETNEVVTKGGIAGFFAMGVAISLNPCAPVLTLVATAANSSSLLTAALMGLAFGLGAVGATLLFYGFLVSTIARELIEQFKNHHKTLERFAALLLALTAIAVFNGWLKL